MSETTAQLFLRDFTDWIGETFNVSEDAARWTAAFSLDSQEASWQFRVMHGTSGETMLGQLIDGGADIPNAIEAVLLRPKSKPSILEILRES